MNLLLRLYPGDHVVHLIAVFSLQLAVVAGAAWVFARVWARQNAAALYAVWLTALLSVPLGALMLAAASVSGISFISLPLLPAERPAPPTVEYAQAQAIGAFGAESTAAFEEGAAVRGVIRDALVWLAQGFQSADTYRAAFSLVMIVWGAGAAWLSVRLLVGVWAVGRLLRNSRPVSSSRSAEMCARIGRELGLRVSPRLLVSRWVTSPICLGLRRPAIILPASLGEKLSASQLHDVLVHECVHILNRDHFWGLLERCAQIVLWPHPAVHLIRQELSRAREELCDNYVLRAARVPEYARTLLMISQQSGHDQPRYMSAIGFLQGPRPLESRVRALLDSRRQLATRMPAAVRAAVGAGVLGVALAAAGVRFVPAETPLPVPMASVVEFPPIAVASAGPSAQAALPAARSLMPTLPMQIDFGAEASDSFDPVALPPRALGPAWTPATIATPATTANFAATASPAAPAMAPVQSAAKPYLGEESAVVRALPRQTRLAQVSNIGMRLGRAARADESASESSGKSESFVSRRGTTTPTLAEVVFDLSDVLQPMVHVEAVDGVYWVTVQAGDSSTARWAVEPGKTAKAVYEESLTARIACELSVEPAEHAGQVRLSYRWALQLGLDRIYVWQSQGEIIPCGQWRPLMPAMASEQPSPRSAAAALAADELLRQCDEAVRLFGIVLDMLND